jgi:segregation and condensation protein A
MTYTVKTLQFEGPLDLLLQLIEKEQLNITEVSLSKITNEYLLYIDKFRVNTQQLSEFLSISSKLLYLKSKSLIPSLKNSEMEEEIKDLKEQLEEYRHYKKAASELKSHYEKNLISHSGQGKTKITGAVFEPGDVKYDDLLKTFQEVLKRMPPTEPLKEKKIEKQISIEEKWAEILNNVETKKQILLSDFLNKSKSRIEVVVTFLAILEMIKQGIIAVTQKNNFSDILITKGGSGEL